MNVQFGALIIGDEILSGRRQDKHFPQLVAQLKARGLRLAWARYVADDRPALIAALRESFGTNQVVMSFGGIGATPDDHTRQAAAAALGVPLVLHPKAEAEIRARFNNQVTPHRLAMGTFPEGADIIPNPYNRIPGFAVKQHFFMPGFPEMAWPMLEWVLDTHFKHLHFKADFTEAAIMVWEASEGQLVDLMEQVTLQYPQVDIFSLPILRTEKSRAAIELGAKGPAEQVSLAMNAFREGIRARGIAWDEAR